MAPHEVQDDVQNVAPATEGAGKCAVDDSSDEDEDTCQLMKVKSAERKVKLRGAKGLRIQEVLPFHFSPIFLPLTMAHLDSCVALENAAFTDPAHRCTPDKAAYRLTHCSDISFGLFTSVRPSEAQHFGLETLPAAKPVETSREDGAVHVLLAHAIATLGKSPVVTDADMDYPRNWRDRDAAGPRSSSSSVASDTVGHREDGRTICLHSFAVSPKLQGLGVGRMAMRSYIQIMNESGIADRIALICQDYLVGYYRKFGFQNMGESKCSFGGGGWYDMVLDLGGPPHPEREFRSGKAHRRQPTRTFTCSEKDG